MTDNRGLKPVDSTFRNRNSRPIDRDQPVSFHRIDRRGDAARWNVGEFFENTVLADRSVLKLPIERIAHEIEDIDFQVVEFHITPLRGLMRLVSEKKRKLNNASTAANNFNKNQANYPKR